MTLTYRRVKGSQLTSEEADANVDHLLLSANHTFVQSGTAPRTRTSQDKMREIEVAPTDYTGVDITGATSSSTAFANALAAAKLVRVKAGTYKLDSLTAVPANTTLLLEAGVTINLAITGGGDVFTLANGAALIGGGYGGNGTNIVALSGTNVARIVTNADKTGAQQYCFLEGFNITVNSGATVSVAPVDFVSVFTPSFIRNVVVNCNSQCGPGIRVASLASAGLGPIVLENLWSLNSTANGMDIIDVVSSGASCVWMRNITCEHQASGFHGLRLVGVTGLGSVHLTGFHYENSNTFSSAGAGIYVDGVSLLGDEIQIWSSPIGNKKGVWISSNARNLRVQLRGVTNGNLVTPILQDDQNSISYGAVNPPYYATPDLGMYRNVEQTLSYSASISWDLALGNRALLDVTNGTAFTLNSPTNTGSCQEIQIEVSNSSGGAMGTVTLGGNFAYTDTNGLPAGKPANGKRRVYTYRRRSSTDTWVQVSATGDM